MSIKSDIWLRAQSERPTHVVEKYDGSIEYAIRDHFTPMQQQIQHHQDVYRELLVTNEKIGEVGHSKLPVMETNIIRPITEKELNNWKPMIEPFNFGSVNKKTTQFAPGASGTEKIISYGTSSFGYDLRIGNQFKIFTNINSTVVNPKNFDTDSFVEYEGDVCIIPPNSFVLASSLEYIRMPRNVTGVVLGKSTYARCFTEDTKVVLADGTTPNFKELIERYKNGERIFGYSINDNLEIVISEFIEPRKIGTEEVIEVVLDNDEIIECTADHKFITREGLEIKAEDLRPGDSLFPLYKIQSRGYETVVQPNNWTLTPCHRLADEWNIRHNIYSIEENQHRHHINENRIDNNPTNIERKNASLHITEHNLERCSNPEYINKLSEIQKQLYAKKCEDPEWVKKWSEHCRNAANLFWTDDKYEESRNRHRQKIIDYNNSSEGLINREKNRQLSRLRANTEAFKSESSMRLHKLWQDPEYREMMSEKCRSLNIREDITEKEVIDALETEGSIRGAARKLNCDRTVFRRFENIISKFKEKWEASKITCEDFYKVLCQYGSATKAAKALGIGRSYVTKYFQDAIRKFYNEPSLDNNHKVVEIRRKGSVKDVYCLTAPEFGNFALAAGVFVNNCGIVCIATPLEAGWEGYVTLEFSNTTPLPAMLFANEGAAQVLFFEGENCFTSYADRGGKYQHQEAGPVLPKM